MPCLLISITPGSNPTASALVGRPSIFAVNPSNWVVKSSGSCGGITGASGSTSRAVISAVGTNGGGVMVGGVIDSKVSPLITS